MATFAFSLYVGSCRATSPGMNLKASGFVGPMASVVMAAYCHPRPGGGRFS